MKKRIELIIGLLGISIALLAWLFPFNSNAHSPFSAKNISTNNVLTTDTPTNPQWLERLKHYPLIPGEGLAGIQLGDSEEYVLSLLGKPSDEVSPVTGDSGEITKYALKYEIAGIFLGIYTDRNTREVISFRLYDLDINKDKFLPSYNGITIGSPESALTEFLGEPLITRGKSGNIGCLLDDGAARIYEYDGIGFFVCDSNGLIYLIDIPE